MGDESNDRYTAEMTASAFIAGLGLGASLIIAIGAQNAFVLRQGLLRSHALAVAALCVAIDWSLIVVGALGFGALVGRFPALTSIAAWGGAAFLLVYGALAFRSAIRPGSLHAENAVGARDPKTLSAALATTLAVSLLNPHVYLDTVVLLGGVAAHYPPDERVAFVLGAGVASAVWFFGLALGARMLTPIFEREVAWRVLDVIIGCVMWWIAAGLVLGQVAG
jgi:L-lysine exporter family protein LysE/ArgO